MAFVRRELIDEISLNASQFLLGDRRSWSIEGGGNGELESMWMTQLSLSPAVSLISGKVTSADVAWLRVKIPPTRENSLNLLLRFSTEDVQEFRGVVSRSLDDIA